MKLNDYVILLDNDPRGMVEVGDIGRVCHDSLGLEDEGCAVEFVNYDATLRGLIVGNKTMFMLATEEEKRIYDQGYLDYLKDKEQEGD